MIQILNILLLKPSLRLTIHLVIYITIYMLISPTVYAMESDRDTIKEALTAVQQGDEQEVRRILEILRDIRDPVRLATINRIIEEYRVLYNMPMDMLQGTDTLTIANSGIPIEERRSWRSILTSTAIFVGVSVIIYLIYRNFHHLTDFFRDFGERAIDIGMEQMRMLGRVSVILNHSPEAREAFVTELMRQGILIHPHAMGG